MKFLISAALGGSIGYFTNWLAIKMLFRPYEAKYLGGIKLPFTPGLIPKERDRMAENIAITVKDYLLSPDDILESIEGEKFKDLMEKEIELFLNEIKENEVKLSDLKINTNAYRDKFENTLKSEVLRNKIKNYLSSKILSVDESNFTKGIDYFYEEIISNESFKISIEESLVRFLDNIKNENRSLGEFISEDIKEDIFEFLRENSKIISFKLRELINKEDMKIKIKSIIKGIVEENLSPLVLNFVPLDLISEKGYEALDNYLRGHDSSQDINKLITSGISIIYESPIKDLSRNLVDEVDEKLISKRILEGLSKDSFKIALTKASYQSYKKIDKDQFIDKIDSLYLDLIASKEFTLFVDRLENNFLNFKIYDGFKLLNLDNEKIYSILTKLFIEKIKPRLSNFIELIDIGEIVKNRVNSFSNEFVEELILDIAYKELKAITRLGGLLGAIIGLLSPILQSIWT